MYDMANPRRKDPLSRSHLVSQSRQRSANFNQVPPAFPDIRIVSFDRTGFSSDSGDLNNLCVGVYRR